VDLGTERLTADALLVAAGRRPALDGLRLDRAHVVCSPEGIAVDDWLRTSQKHIYACGDALGSFQFTHYAGWQAVVAARNALLPGRRRGCLETVPWTLFTEPEVAQVGLSEAQAQERHGPAARVLRWPIEPIDRAVTEGDTEGFLKLIHLPNGRLLGATIVCRRAGELADELSLALSKRLTLSDLAGAIHVYPTYDFALQQAAAEGYFQQLDRARLGALTRLLARGWPARQTGGRPRSR
jgi:pyruvate/2-oxoglutarate dehydrogenase complex dihydrolipoamide dehydrogenase (E3) component